MWRTPVAVDSFLRRDRAKNCVTDALTHLYGTPRQRIVTTTTTQSKSFTRRESSLALRGALHKRANRATRCTMGPLKHVVSTSCHGHASSRTERCSGRITCWQAGVKLSALLLILLEPPTQTDHVVHRKADALVKLNHVPIRRANLQVNFRTS